MEVLEIQDITQNGEPLEDNNEIPWNQQKSPIQGELPV